MACIRVSCLVPVGGGVDDEGDIDEASPSRDIGEVREPQHVRPGATELTVRLRADRQQMGVPDPGQHPDAAGRLFPGHDRGDHHPGADPASCCDEIWRGSRAFRPHHDAEPDDRSPSSAAWYGALCLVAGGKTVGRAHHHGDSALAGAAGPGIAADHLRAGDYAVAAAAGRANPVIFMVEWA